METLVRTMLYYRCFPMAGGASDKRGFSRAKYLGEAWLDDDALAAFEADSAEGFWPFLLATAFVLSAFAAALAAAWYLAAPRFGQFWAPLPWILLGAAAAALLYLLAEYAGLALTVITGKPLVFPLVRRRLTLKLTPVVSRLAKPFGKTVDRMVNSFVRVNNAVVRSLTGKVGGPVLVLLPRCIQRIECEQVITEDVEYCRRCGKCPMAELMDLRAEYENVEYYVLTGGRVAAEVIRKVRPAAIIGVACERELLAGIDLVEKIPVIGLANVRPEGPCFQTRVCVEDVVGALDHFATRKPKPC